ncbi:YkvA family protein [[Clostridium] dakarense]|uniref:YkvA family protein n=1 Tax=Faecalimicrobium dakarense TaxID=1301100 RepID=UPI0004ACEF8B|nr:DUF1232 domain-containing protein [[Clostridium] dakarense]
MKKVMKVIDFLLDGLKRILVRFKNAKFGLLFIINIFSIPDFITDRTVNIISKFKVIFSLGTAILYMVSGIDFIPEMITGVFGFIDDILVVVWSLGIVNEELAKYKKSIKENIDPNIIEGVNFHIKDDKE